jgi:dTDP-4-amino-4,6-dideoxygalactose transaminase
MQSVFRPKPFPRKPIIATQVPFVDLRAQYRRLRRQVLSAFDDALEGMQLFLGPNVRAFEDEFAAYCGVRHAVGVGSGTDALYLALRACGIRPGDEVITVAHTFIGTVEAIVQAGARPVFVDIDPDTYTLDPTGIEAALSPQTRAIVPVHLYGQMADMDPIMDLAQRHGLLVVEDACQAHGAEYKGRRAGSIGDAAAFSFYMSKNLGAYGEAGAVTTNSNSIAEMVARLRNHGSVSKYDHAELGVNSRLDELQAVVLRVKLNHLDEWVARRRQHAALYISLLRDAPVKLPVTRRESAHVYHLFVVQVDDRDRVRQGLEARSIGCDVHYPIPLHRQAACQNIGRVAGDLKVTELVAGRILSLPMFPELTKQQVQYVAASLLELVN